MSIGSLPIFVALPIVVVFSALITILFTSLIHYLVHPARTDENAQLCSTLATRLGAIQAFILALSFNTVLFEYNELRESIDEEAVLISLVLEDLSEELPVEQALPRIAELANYVNSVIEEDWKVTSPLSINLTADDALYNLRNSFNTIPKSMTEMVKEVDQLLDEIERLRMQRLFDYDDELPSLFWGMVIGLFFLALVPMSYFKRNRVSNYYLSAYGISCGIVMYVMLIYSQPFQTSLSVDNRPFKVILILITDVYGTLENSLDEADKLRILDVKNKNKP